MQTFCKSYSFASWSINKSVNEPIPQILKYFTDNTDFTDTEINATPFYIRCEKAIKLNVEVASWLCSDWACQAAPELVGGVSGSFLLSEGAFIASFWRMGRLWSWRVQVPFLKLSHLDNERRAESFLCCAAVKKKVFTGVERRLQGVILREVLSAFSGNHYAYWVPPGKKTHNAAQYFSVVLVSPWFDWVKKTFVIVVTEASQACSRKGKKTKKPFGSFSFLSDSKKRPDAKIRLIYTYLSA